MTRPRKFTLIELGDLARGCRALAQLDQETYEKNKHTTIARQFLESKKHHEEMAELCEAWKKFLERREFEKAKQQKLVDSSKSASVVSIRKKPSRER